MKRVFKRIMAVLVVLALALPVLPVAAATGNESWSELEFNGEAVTLTDAFPLIAEGENWWDDDVLYLPLRALGDAMGAETEYDNGLVSFTYKGTTLAFDIIGDLSEGTVTGAGGTVDYQIVPEPMVVGGRTLIAADTLEDVFGLIVSYTWEYTFDIWEPWNSIWDQYDNDEIDWDEAGRLLDELFEAAYESAYIAVQVFDLSDMLDGFDDSFTIVNKILAASLQQTDAARTGTLTGQADFRVPILGGLLGVPLSVSFEAGVETLSSELAGSGGFAADMGLASLQPYIGDNEDILMAFEMLNNLELNYILDAEEGQLYIQSPLFELFGKVLELDGLDGDTWYVLPVDDFADIAESPLSLTVSQLVEMIIRERTEIYDGVTYAVTLDDIMTTMELFTTFLSDEQFTVSGDEDEPVYTLKLTMASFADIYDIAYDLEHHYDGIDMDFAVEVSFSAGEDGTIKTGFDLWFMYKDDYNSAIELKLRYEESSVPYDGVIPSAPPGGAKVSELPELFRDWY
jgi:hypothetical protein